MATERDTRRADPRALSTRPDGISTMRNSLIPPYSCRAQGPRGVVAIDGSRAEAIAFLSEQGAPAPLSLVEQAEADGQAEATTADGTLLWVDCDIDEQPQSDAVEGHHVHDWSGWLTFDGATYRECRTCAEREFRSPIEERAEAIIDAAVTCAYDQGAAYGRSLIDSSAFRYQPEAPLSGEWSDAPTDRTVYAEAMTAAGASIADREAIADTLSPEVVDTIAEAWLEGFASAPWGDFEDDYPLSVCVDCARAASYDDDDSEREADQPAPLALVPLRRMLVIASPDEHPNAEPSFSWRSCDTCGSRLGGDRYAGALIER